MSTCPTSTATTDVPSPPTPAAAGTSSGITYDTIAGWLRLLIGDDPQAVTELRVLGCRQRPGGRPLTYSGYYDRDHLDAMARAAVQYSRSSDGIYWTLNPVHPDLLSRRCNRADVAESGGTTTGADILRRRWLLVDVDPVRRAGISSTDAEKAAALDIIHQVRDGLRARGWPAPIFADSGNGYHLLYRIDLPVDDGGLVRRVLHALAAKFDRPAAKVDTAVFDANRIVKLYGTVARKGDNTPDRPHRQSRILEIPTTIDILTEDDI